MSDQKENYQEQIQAEIDEVERILTSSLNEKERKHVESYITYLRTVMDLAIGNSASFRAEYRAARATVIDLSNKNAGLESDKTILESKIEGLEQRLARLTEENRWLKISLEAKGAMASSAQIEKIISEETSWQYAYVTLHDTYERMLKKFRELRRFRPDNFSIEELEKSLERKRRIEKKEPRLPHPEWEPVADGQNYRYLSSYRLKIEKEGERVTLESTSGSFHITFALPNYIRIFKKRKDADDAA